VRTEVLETGVGARTARGALLSGSSIATEAAVPDGVTGNTAVLQGALGRLLEDAFQRHRHEIRRFLLLRVGDAETADDLTQDVFVDAAEWLARHGDPPQSIVRLLQAVATRRAADFWRRRAEYVETSDVPEREDALPEWRRVDEAVGAAMRAIPALDRRVVAMRVLQGCGFREIAEVTRSSEAACRMRFSRGGRVLRPVLAAVLGASGIDVELLL